jgi:hypothetical protein
VRYCMDMRVTDDDGSSAARVGTGEPASCTTAKRVVRLQNRSALKTRVSWALVGYIVVEMNAPSPFVRTLVQTPLVVWCPAHRATLISRCMKEPRHSDAVSAI